MEDIAATQAGWNDVSPVMAEEPPSFEDFFLDQRDRLFQILSVITGSRQEAEDLSQEAFARVWERWDTVSVMENPAGYVHRTAMNLFRNRYRRGLMAARRSIVGRVDEDAYAVVDDRHVALQVLRSLSPRQRAAVVLTDVLGYTADESASMLGVRPATVRALHFQARAALKRMREAQDV